MIVLATPVALVAVFWWREGCGFVASHYHHCCLWASLFWVERFGWWWNCVCSVALSVLLSSFGFDWHRLFRYLGCGLVRWLDHDYVSGLTVPLTADSWACVRHNALPSICRDSWWSCSASPCILSCFVECGVMELRVERMVVFFRCLVREGVRSLVGRSQFCSRLSKLNEGLVFIWWIALVEVVKCPCYW